MALLTLVAATCAYALGAAAFDRQRLSVAVADGTSSRSVELADAARQIADPVLVVTARLQNQSATQPAKVQMSVGGAQAAAEIPAGRHADIVLIWDRRHRTGSSLEMRGSDEGLRLARVELSNARGFTRGLVNLSIVPRDQPLRRHPMAVAALLLLWSGTFWLVLSGIEPAASRWLGLAAAVAVAFFAVTALSGVVSPYQVVLAPRSFLLLSLMAAAPWAGPIVRSVLAFVPRPRRTRGVVVAASAACALIFYGGVVMELSSRLAGNYSGFLRISRATAATAPFLISRPELVAGLMLYDHGYDGQFMFLMTFDPFLLEFRDQPERYREVVDFPPYRYGRPGFSVLARPLSLGDPARVPVVMVWLTVVSSALMVACLSVWSGLVRAPPWYALLAIAIPGYLYSVTVGLPEGLASACLLAGLVAITSQRPWLGVIGLASALLVRETGVVLLAAIIWSESKRTLTWRAAALVAALTPVLAWRCYVGARLYADWGLTAFVPGSADFTWPLTGFWALWVSVAAGAHPGTERLAALVYPAVVCAAAGVAAFAARRTGSPFAVAAIAYAAIALTLNYPKVWSHVPSGERATHELFLALVLTAMHVHQTDPIASRRIVWLMAAVAAYTLLASPESEYARAALLLIR